MKMFFVLVSMAAIGGMLYVQFGTGKVSVADKLGPISSSFLGSKESNDDEFYRGSIIGRWSFNSLARQGWVMTGTLNYLKDGTFIIDADIGSKYGSQDFVGKGSYRIREGVVYTNISEIFPIELRHMKVANKLKSQYVEKIVSLSKNEIVLQGKGRERHTLSRF